MGISGSCVMGDHVECENVGDACDCPHHLRDDLPLYEFTITAHVDPAEVDDKLDELHAVFCDDPTGDDETKCHALVGSARPFPKDEDPDEIQLAHRSLAKLRDFYRFHFVENAEDGIAHASAADQCVDLYVLLGDLGMKVR